MRTKKRTMTRRNLKEAADWSCTPLTMPNGQAKRDPANQRCQVRGGNHPRA